MTGMRPDEVTIMRPVDIEKANGIWFYCPREHKMEHKDIEKVIPLGPRAQKLLSPWLDRAPNAYLFSPREVVEAIKKARALASARDTILVTGSFFIIGEAKEVKFAKKESPE